MLAIVRAVIWSEQFCTITHTASPRPGSSADPVPVGRLSATARVRLGPAASEQKVLTPPTLRGVAATMTSDDGGPVFFDTAPDGTEYRVAAAEGLWYQRARVGGATGAYTDPIATPWEAVLSGPGSDAPDEASELPPPANYAPGPVAVRGGLRSGAWSRAGRGLSCPR